MNDSRSRVLIVGAGIGGLTMALALQRRGMDVTVFEKSPAVGEVGAGVQIWTNGLMALHAIGLGEAIESVSGPIERQLFRTETGRVLIDLRLGDLARSHGLPVPVISTRPGLIHALYTAVGPGLVQLGMRCTGFRQAPDGATALFENGREEHGSVLIAADGIDSVIRQQLHPAVHPRYAGYQYLRALTQLTHHDFAPRSLSLFFGRGDRYGLADVGHGRTYAFGIIKAPQGAGDPPEGRKAELVQRYRTFAPVVRAAIESTPESAIGRTDIRDFPPLNRWGEGRVTLIGDAAHATTPNMGRGATEAIVDAIVLSNYLTQSEDPVSALRSYEEQRRAPTARITSTSWRVGQMASWEHAAACTARQWIMRVAMGPGMKRMMDSEMGELERNATLLSVRP